MLPLPQGSWPVLVLPSRMHQRCRGRKAPPNGRQHVPAEPEPRRPASPDAAVRTRFRHSPRTRNHGTTTGQQIPREALPPECHRPRQDRHRTLHRKEQQTWDASQTSRQVPARAKTRDGGQTGSRNAGQTGSRNAGQTGSRNAGQTGSRNAGQTGSRNAGQRGSRNAGQTGYRDEAQARRRNPGRQRIRHPVRHPAPCSVPHPAHRSVPGQMTGRTRCPRSGSYPNSFSCH